MIIFLGFFFSFPSTFRVPTEPKALKRFWRMLEGLFGLILEEAIQHSESDHLANRRVVTPQIFEGQFFFFHTRVQCTSLFTYPKYIKLYFSNIFLQNATQGHNSTFFLLTASRERRLLVYLKRGGPTTG